MYFAQQVHLHPRQNIVSWICRSSVCWTDRQKGRLQHGRESTAPTVFSTARAHAQCRCRFKPIERQNVQTFPPIFECSTSKIRICSLRHAKPYMCMRCTNRRCFEKILLCCPMTLNNIYCALLGLHFGTISSWRIDLRTFSSSLSGSRMSRTYPSSPSAGQASTRTSSRGRRCWTWRRRAPWRLCHPSRRQPWDGAYGGRLGDDGRRGGLGHGEEERLWRAQIGGEPCHCLKLCMN